MTSEEKIRVLREGLTAAAERFREYEQIHRAKAKHEGFAKAERNQRMAELCERALSTTEPAPRDSSAPGKAGYPMDCAPKDSPILAYCDHEADPFEQGKTADGRTILTLYAAHYEGMSHAPTGFHIVEWGGAFDDSTWEYPDQANLPDWWFVAGSEFEVAANPVRWWPLPVPQPAAGEGGE